MCKKTKVITIDGQDVLVAYKETLTGIVLYKTVDAKTGDTVWLNLNEQKKAKSQLRV